MMKPPMDNPRRLIVFTDSGDMIVDESTQERDGTGIVQRAALIPCAAETLRALRGAGFTVALVADGEWDSFQNVYQRHGLADCFDAWIVSDRVGVEKPAPEMFEATMRALGLEEQDKRRIVMIGNNLKKDIAGANRLGLRSIWLDWSPRYFHCVEKPDWQPEYTVRTPAELLPLLLRLDAALE